MSFLEKFKVGLSKTSKNLREKVLGVFSPGKLSSDFLDQLEEALIEADIGIEAAMAIREQVQEESRKNAIRSEEDLFSVMTRVVESILSEVDAHLKTASSGPTVYVLVGVNGSGKTTTIGKLAKRFTSQGKSVIVAAADTFRAAAEDQLAVWAKRSGATIISHQEGSDPGAVAFDAIKSALARNVDVVLVDTAGRLQTKKNLMEELRKVIRVIKREIPDAPHEVILVIDGTTGQNGLSQAKVFMEAAGVTGICVTKLDGTSKGGIAVAITKDLGIPVKLVGVGEGIEDLRDFDPSLFAKALFER
ncbi:MAG TPA: signal recognition particle-docking protein FtsY [Firmicutes bacterium]|nr:signal recognition particle-docking protein FtsY [Candidatus Fermentithermobacillaceae bacterium]